MQAPAPTMSKPYTSDVCLVSALASFTLINLDYIAVNRGDYTRAHDHCLQALQDIRAIHLQPAEG